MIHNYEKSIEVHNELRVNVDEQQSGLDDAEEFLEITAARTSRKEKIISMCLSHVIKHR